MKNNDGIRNSKKKSKKNKIYLNQEGKFNTSVFRHVPIDRFIILPLVIILPFWAEVAGGLLHTQPAGAGDGALAMLPLSIVILFFVSVARTLFNFVSSSKKKNAQRRQNTSSSKNRDVDEEDEDEIAETVPRFYCEPSDLYTSKTLNSSPSFSSKSSSNNTNFQQSCRNFLRKPVGRFLSIGDVCWNNPTLRYDPATQSIASVPMPSLFSMFLMTFNSYQGPEKIIRKKKTNKTSNRRSSRAAPPHSGSSRRRSSNNNLDDFEGFEFTRYDHELLGSPPSSSSSPSKKQQQKHRSNSRHSPSLPSSSRRKSLDQQHHHHPHQLTLNPSFTVRGMSMSMSLSSSSHHFLSPPSPTSNKKKTNSSSSATRRSHSNNKLLFPSTPPAAANNNNSRNLLADALDVEIASEKVYFDFSLRRRLQIVWLPFTVILTLIVCLVGGVSTVDKSKCFDVFFVVLILCAINFFVLLYLRPYITPVKTVISASIDFFTVIGGLILLSCVTSAKTREELDSLIAAGQWLCTLPGSILGVFTLLSGASRTISLLICKSQVAPQSLLRSRIRSELDELEQELLPVMINRSLSLGSSSSFVPAASSSSFSPGTSKEEYIKNKSQTFTPSAAVNGSGSSYHRSRKSPNDNNSSNNNSNTATSSSLTKSSSFRQPQGFLKDLF